MTYFNELIQINKIFIKEENNVRLDEEEIQKVCNKLNTFYSSAFNLDEFIKLCIVLFNMQIFYDGNSRTIITYITKILDDNGYCIDIEKAELDEKDIHNIKKYIFKKESKGIVK